MHIIWIRLCNVPEVWQFKIEKSPLKPYVAWIFFVNFFRFALYLFVIVWYNRVAKEIFLSCISQLQAAKTTTTCIFIGLTAMKTASLHPAFTKNSANKLVIFAADRSICWYFLTCGVERTAGANAVAIPKLSLVAVPLAVLLGVVACVPDGAKISPVNFFTDLNGCAVNGNKVLFVIVLYKKSSDFRFFETEDFRHGCKMGTKTTTTVRQRNSPFRSAANPLKRQPSLLTCSAKYPWAIIDRMMRHKAASSIMSYSGQKKRGRLNGTQTEKSTPIGPSLFPLEHRYDIKLMVKRGFFSPPLWQ